MSSFEMLQIFAALAALDAKNCRQVFASVVLAVDSAPNGDLHGSAASIAALG